MHTIRIQHWNEFEDKLVPGCYSPRVIGSQEKVKEAIEDVAGWGLPRVNTTTNKNYLWTTTVNH